MTYEEAVIGLKYGKPVRRRGWGKHWARASELLDRFFYGDNEKTKETPMFFISVDDLLALDWEVGKFHPVTGHAIFELEQKPSQTQDS